MIYIGVGKASCPGSWGVLFSINGRLIYIGIDVGKWPGSREDYFL